MEAHRESSQKKLEDGRNVQKHAWMLRINGLWTNKGTVNGIKTTLDQSMSTKYSGMGFQALSLLSAATLREELNQRHLSTGDTAINSVQRETTHFGYCCCSCLCYSDAENAGRIAGNGLYTKSTKVHVTETTSH